MKINYSLMSTDTNPLYYDFIPVMIKTWNRLGITPVFAIVSDKNGIEINNDCIYYYFKVLPNIKPNFQTLFARIWLWKELQGNCILSDIDMLPISSDYFNGIASNYDDDYIVSYCHDAKALFDQIASCYILASSGTMNNLIAETSWNEFIYNRAKEYEQAWGGDQVYLETLCDAHDKLATLERGWFRSGIAHNRLDRISWYYNDEDVITGKIYDAHLLRPYVEHKEKIDNLVALCH